MNVLYVNRPNALTNKGGDTIQMIKTKEYIEKAFKVNISICENINDANCFKKADLVHIFNIQTADYTRKALNMCKKMQKKAVISTIFWDIRSASHVNLLYNLLGIKPNEFIGNIEFLGNITNKMAYNFTKNKSNILFNKKDIARSILIDADYLLPNSDEELLLLSQIYNIDLDLLLKKTRVIPNAIDYDLAKNSTSADVYIKDYVLQVGRIEPIKNQINTVKALLKYKDIPIIFIGRIGNKNYYNDLRRISNIRGNVHFINEVKNSEIYNYYKNAKCHVLPSFRESPGLVSIEALMCNIPIVISKSKYCPIKYYKFDKYGYICDPYSVKSIQNAILEALSNGMKETLPEDYRYFYSYENVAIETVKAYKSIVNGSVIL